MKSFLKFLVLVFLVKTTCAAPVPQLVAGLALNPSNQFSYLHVDLSGALLLAQMGPGGSSTSPQGVFGVALDPNNAFQYLHVDSTGGLIVSGSYPSIFGTPTTGQLATWASATTLQGVTALPAANFPAMTGDVTSTAGSLATTVAAIQGTTVTGTTGSGKVVFGTGPTITGAILVGSPTTNGIPTLTAGGVIQNTPMTLSTDGNTITFPGGTILQDSSGSLNLTTLNFNVKATGTSTISLFSGGTQKFLVESTSGDSYMGTEDNHIMHIFAHGADAIVLSTAQHVQFPGSIYLSPGVLSTDSSGNITTASDSRLKNYERPFRRGLSAVLQLRPIIFHWNKLSGLNQMDVNAGFFAQDVMKCIPEAVGKNGEGYYSLIDRPITAALVNAVKELADRPGTAEIRIFELAALLSLLLHLRRRKS